jgi:hypothetical protein
MKNRKIVIFAFVCMFIFVSFSLIGCIDNKLVGKYTGINDKIVGPSHIVLELNADKSCRIYRSDDGKIEGAEAYITLFSGTYSLSEKDLTLSLTTKTANGIEPLEVKARVLSNGNIQLATFWGGVMLKKQ